MQSVLGILAEEARRLVQSLNLPVDLIAHRNDAPRFLMRYVADPPGLTAPSLR